MPLSSDLKVWAGWDGYFKSLSHHDQMIIDVEAYTNKLRRLSRILFKESIDVQEMVLSPYSHNEKVFDSTTFRDKQSLGTLLTRLSSPLHKIISISQDHSLAPFNIDEESMCKILGHYRVSPDFVDVMLNFGDKKATPSEGPGKAVFRNISERTFDIVYHLRYIEENGYKQGDPWSLRQVGVYHSYSMPQSGEAESFYILLHPMRNCKVQSRLAAVANSDLDFPKTGMDPLSVHTLIFSSYIDNWRWYIHSISRECGELEDLLLTCDLDDCEEYLGLSFSTLQTLRHLASKLIPVPAILRASIATLGALQTMNESLTQLNSGRKVAETAQQLASYSSRLEDYIESTYVVQQRIENMTKFLANSLDLQNQSISVDMNGHLITLTKDTVDDSSTVRTITIVTLIYLPASFITGLFGMNLFSFDPSTTSLQISKQFWIFVVATIILTTFTFGVWKYHTRRQRKRERSRDSTRASAV